MEIKSKLTPHQQEVFEKITSKIKKNLSSRISNILLSDRFLSLTGAAGTGKSYMTSAIVKEIDCFKS
jgi:DNA replication protein DnaC